MDLPATLASFPSGIRRMCSSPKPQLRLRCAGVPQAETAERVCSADARPATNAEMSVTWLERARPQTHSKRHSCAQVRRDCRCFYLGYRTVSGFAPYLRLAFVAVPTFRIREAADLLGVSDDTVRRWADAGRIPTSEEAGRRVIDGPDLAHFAQELAASADRPKARPVVGESARNRFVGLVTRVVRDTVMAQVDMQAGPHRIVSLMSREAADELDLEPGVIAVASVKATSVVVEVPEHRSGRMG